MLVTVGPWRAEVTTTEVMEVITVTTGVVGEAAVLTTVADMTIIVLDREAIVMTTMVEEEEVTGTVAEVEDQRNTQPRNSR